MIFSSALNLEVVIAWLLHAGGTGFWDEVLGIVCTLLFLVILIDLIFFEGRQDKPSRPQDKTTDQTGQKR